MSENNNNDRNWLRRSIPYAGIGAGVAVIALLISVGQLFADAGAQKERIDNIEKRQIEDRTVTQRSLERIESRIIKTDENVVNILIRLETLGALRREGREGREGR